MSYYALLDQDYGADVASVGGWHDFIVWAQSLDKKQFSQIHHLATQGCNLIGKWAADQGLPDLADQLKEALKSDPPTAEGVEDTAQGIIALVAGVGDAHDIIIITDGTGDTGAEDVPPENEELDTEEPPPEQKFILTD